MFIVVNKRKLRESQSFDHADSVAAHLLGRRLADYVVIKSNSEGDRTVPLTTPYAHEIQQQLEQA